MCECTCACGGVMVAVYENREDKQRHWANDNCLGHQCVWVFNFLIRTPECQGDNLSKHEVKVETRENSAFRRKKKKIIFMYRENNLSLEQRSIILFLVLPCAYICVYARFDFYRYFIMSSSSSQIACSFDFISLLQLLLHLKDLSFSFPIWTLSSQPSSSPILSKRFSLIITVYWPCLSLNLNHRQRLPSVHPSISWSQAQNVCIQEAPKNYCSMN